MRCEINDITITFDKLGAGASTDDLSVSNACLIPVSVYYDKQYFFNVHSYVSIEREVVADDND